MNSKKRKEGIRMQEFRSRIFMNFFVRAVLGCALIFFVNQFLDVKGIDLKVGMNPLTIAASGALGVPGVALLYGISFYQGL